MTKLFRKIITGLLISATALTASTTVFAAVSPARQYTAANSEYHTLADASLSNIDVNGLNPFYFCTWVYSGSIAPGVSNRVVAGHGDSSTDRGWGLLYNNGVDRFRLLATHDGATSSIADFGSAPAQNTWYFLEAWYDGVSSIGIAMTAEGAGSRASDVTASLLLGLWNSSQPFQIGNGYGNPVWDGRIQASFFVYGAVPTTGERDAFWNSGNGVLSANKPSLSVGSYGGCWDGNETSGDLVDSCGTNTLTDTNTVTSTTGHVVIASGGAAASNTYSYSM